jgi:hypothetical protein
MESQEHQLQDYALKSGNVRRQLDESLGPVCRICGDRIALANEQKESAEREERLRPINLLVQRLKYDLDLDRGESIGWMKTASELAQQPKELLQEHGIYSALERLAEHLDKKERND